MSRQQDLVWLFSYGTLKPGMRNYTFIADSVLDAEPGAALGRMVDVADGEYPALIRGPIGGIDSDRYVLGWWLLITVDALREADQIEEFFGMEEENFYERVWTKDLFNPNREGWIYVWPSDRGRPTIDSAVWLPR